MTVTHQIDQFAGAAGPANAGKVLVATGFQEAWPEPSRIVFLGQWCNAIDRYDGAFAAKCETLPYHWRNLDEINDALAQVNQLHDKLTESVGQWLNRLHSSSHSPDYWRIVVGPFLLTFLCIVYDRLIALTRAFEKYPDAAFRGIHIPNIAIPATNADFITLATQSESWNLDFYTKLARELNPSAVEIVPTRDFKLESARELILSKLRSRRARVCLQSAAASVSRFAPIVINLQHMAVRDRLLFTFKSGGRIAPLFHRCWSNSGDLTDAGIRPLPAVRAGLADLPVSTQLEKVACALLPNVIPMANIEGFRHFEAEGRRLISDRARVIVSDTGWFQDISFAIRAAELRESHGAVLVGSQHGGSYGTIRSIAYNAIEGKLDYFATWGWSNEKWPNAIPLPSPRLHSLGRPLRSKALALWVGTAIQRYPYLLDSVPLGDQALIYCQWRDRFATALSDMALSAMAYRPYPDEMGWKNGLDFQNRFPLLKIEKSKRRNFGTRLRRAPLLICDNDNTTFYQGISANIPTVAFWDRKIWGLNAEGEAAYAALEKVGIFHPSPEAAALHVETVIRTPETWWADSAVQRARLKFCDRFALTSPAWQRRWCGELLRIATSTRPRTQRDLRQR